MNAATAPIAVAPAGDASLTDVELARLVAVRALRFGSAQARRMARRLPGATRRMTSRTVHATAWAARRRGPVAALADQGWSLWSLRSRWSFAAVGSHSSALSAWSLLSAGSVASVGSVGSILSIGSTGSILSIGSIGSVLSIGSAGATLSIGSGPWRDATRTRRDDPTGNDPRRRLRPAGGAERATSN